MLSKLSLLVLSLLSLSSPSLALATTSRTLNFELNNSAPIPKGIHGINANWYRFLPIEHNTTQEALRQINIQQVRFPGGSVGNHYDWSTFRPIWDPNSPSFVYGAKDYFNFHIKTLSPLTFAPIIASLGQEVTYVVNFHSNTNAEIKTGLQKLKDHHVSVKRLELGNELYFQTTPGLTTSVYLSRAKEINDFAKQLFPGVKTGVVVGRELWSRPAPNGNWNIPTQSWFDAVIIHSYSTVSRYNTDQFVDWVTGDKQQEGSLRYHFQQFVQNNIIRNYPGKELWLTEWDLSEDAEGGKDYAGTYAQTYYVYDFLLGLLEYPVVTVANHHSLNSLYKSKNSVRSQYLDPNNYQSVPNNQYSLESFYVKQAQYYPLAWIGQAFSRYNRFVIGTSTKKDVTAVYFYSPSSPNQGSLALINKTAQEVKLSLTGLSLGKNLTLSTLNKPWDTKSTQADEFAPTSATITPSSLTLPPYAIAFLAPASSRPGDLNSDGAVNILDYNLLVSGYGTTYNLSHYNLLVANFQP